MADVAQIHARLTADVSGFTRGMGTAAASVRGLQAATKILSQNANLDSVVRRNAAATSRWEQVVKSHIIANNSLQQSLARSERQALMSAAAMKIMITLPVAAFFAIATKAAMDFEDAFAGIVKTVGDQATPKQLERLGRGIRDMAREVPVTVRELSKIGEIAGQLGVPVHDMEQFIRVVAELGVATDLTFERAAEGMARFLNVMNLPMSAIDRVGNTLVDLGNKMAAGEAEILHIATLMAGTGATVGMTADQVLALGSAMKSVGARSESGASAIQRVFQNMQSAVLGGGEALKQFASTAGMTEQAFAKLFNQNKPRAFEAVLRGLNEIKSAGGNVYAELDKLDLNTIRVTRDLLLMASGVDQLDLALRIAEGDMKNVNARSDEARRRFATTGNQLKIASNAFMDFAISVGQQFLPILSSVASMGSSAFKFLADLPTPLRAASTAFFAFAAGIGPVILGIQMLNRLRNTFTVAGWGQEFRFLAQNLDGVSHSSFRAQKAMSGLKSAIAGVGKALVALAIIASFVEVIDSIFNMNKISDEVRQLNKQEFGAFVRNMDDVKVKSRELADALEIAGEKGIKGFVDEGKGLNPVLEAMAVRIEAVNKRWHEIKGIKAFFSDVGDIAIPGFSSEKEKLFQQESDLRKNFQFLKAVSKATWSAMQGDIRGASRELGGFDANMGKIVKNVDSFKLIQQALSFWGDDQAKMEEFFVTLVTEGQAAALALLKTEANARGAQGALEGLGGQAEATAKELGDLAKENLEAVASFDKWETDPKKSLQAFADASTHNMVTFSRFFDGVKALAKAGFTSIAYTLGKEGPETASHAMDQAIAALARGDTAFLSQIETAYRNWTDAANGGKASLDSELARLPGNLTQMIDNAKTSWVANMNTFGTLAAGEYTKVQEKIAAHMRSSDDWGFIATTQTTAGEMVQIWETRAGELVTIMQSKTGQLQGFFQALDGTVDGIDFSNPITAAKNLATALGIPEETARRVIAELGGLDKMKANPTVGMDTSYWKTGKTQVVGDYRMLNTLPTAKPKVGMDKSLFDYTRAEVINSLTNLASRKWVTWIEAAARNIPGVENALNWLSRDRHSNLYVTERTRRIKPPAGQGNNSGNAVVHSGGLITPSGVRKFHMGGFAGLARDEFPAILQHGEFVMQKSAVDSIGIQALARLNKFHNGGLAHRMSELMNNRWEQTGKAPPMAWMKWMNQNMPAGHRLAEDYSLVEDSFYSKQSLPPMASASGGGTNVTVGSIIIQGTNDPATTARMVREEILKMRRQGSRTPT